MGEHDLELPAVDDQITFEPVTYHFSETELLRLSAAMAWLCGFVRGAGHEPPAIVHEGSSILEERLSIGVGGSDD